MKKRTLPLLLTALLALTASLVPWSAHAASGPVGKVYTQPGDHLVNGRYWKTTCEKYSSTVVRCTTSIWGTKVTGSAGAYSTRQGWLFNTLTYLPSSRASWKSNPLGHNGSWTAPDGRKWRTECDTASTGRNGCRSSVLTTVVQPARSAGGRYTYSTSTQWVVNNIVSFSSSSTPAVTRIPAAAPALKGVPVEQAAPKRTAASKAVSVALSEVGKSYVWGAAGPNAFDCSGLISYAYAKAGVSLPHQSGSQFTVGTHVSKSNLKPGDLVFYYSPISHVGLYIGNGRIVHAANPRSGVTTTSVSAMPFAGAVRVG